MHLKKKYKKKTIAQKNTKKDYCTKKYQCRRNHVLCEHVLLQ